MLRQLLITQSTMSVNALLGHLAEFGLIAAKGISRVSEPIELAGKDATLPTAARKARPLALSALFALRGAEPNLGIGINISLSENNGGGPPQWRPSSGQAQTCGLLWPCLRLPASRVWPLLVVLLS